MNETISAVLREHADGDIHIERLLGAVHAGARRRRRHRLTLAGGALVVVAASVVVTGSMYEREPATVAIPAPEPGEPGPTRSIQARTLGLTHRINRRVRSSAVPCKRPESRISSAMVKNSR